MPNTYPTMNPRDIVIKRETRQRQENISDVDDLMQSIGAIGIINPIVVRLEDGQAVLIAGERRLTASLKLGLTSVPVRFFDDLSAEEAEEIELEENIKRKELAWRDQVKAVGRLHQMYRKKTTGWKIEQTAERLSIHHSYLRKVLHVYEALDGGRINKAESIEQAYNTLHRFSERKAEAIVGDLIVKGAAMFSATAATTTATETTFTTVNAIAVAKDGAADVDEAADMLDDEMIEFHRQKHEQERTTVVTVTDLTTKSAAQVASTEPILNANFSEWIKTYNGPKFTLIHCDFPYGNYRGGDSKGAMSGVETEDFYDNKEEVYWNLLDSLTTNLDKIMSYSAHLMFWFNMNFYSETVARLRKTGLMVHDHPFIHHKTGGPGGLGVVPGTAVTYPRRTYDTALLAVRGNRPLAKPGMNSYAAPTAGNKIHPSQKPEPMLRFFLQMLVDETTTMLDPTCGSGAALRAAEDLGAKSILGLELDKNYAADALTLTLKARVLRQAGVSRREELV